jgi:hypothetical protein
MGSRVWTSADNRRRMMTSYLPRTEWLRGLSQYLEELKTITAQMEQHAQHDEKYLELKRRLNRLNKELVEFNARLQKVEDLGRL